MSVIDTIFSTLSQDEALDGMLARHELAETFPAIYDRWVIEDVPMPYIVLSWDFSRGADGFAENEASLFIDIFTSGSSSRQAEQIVNRLKQILTRNVFHSEGDGPIRTHYVRDGDIPEDVPSVVHWSPEFSVIHWDTSLIKAINNRD